jgi:hypothetical protein
MIMSDAVRGFGGEGSVRSLMSPGLQARIAEEEEREAREAAKLERQRAVKAELWRERSLQAAIAQAVADGENVNPRLAMQGRGIGHTPREFVEMMTYVQDAEDMQAEARERADYLKWKRDRGESTSGDMSAPTPAEAEANRLDAERSAMWRDRMIQRRLTLRQAREQAEAIAARGDRQTLGAVATALRLGSESGYQTSYRTEPGPDCKYYP